MWKRRQTDAENARAPKTNASSPLITRISWVYPGVAVGGRKRELSAHIKRENPSSAQRRDGIRGIGAGADESKTVRIRHWKWSGREGKAQSRGDWRAHSAAAAAAVAAAAASARAVSPLFSRTTRGVYAILKQRAERERENRWVSVFASDMRNTDDEEYAITTTTTSFPPSSKRRVRHSLRRQFQSNEAGNGTDRSTKTPVRRKKNNERKRLAKHVAEEREQLRGSYEKREKDRAHLTRTYNFRSPSCSHKFPLFFFLENVSTQDVPLLEVNFFENVRVSTARFAPIWIFQVNSSIRKSGKWLIEIKATLGVIAQRAFWECDRDKISTHLYLYTKNKEKFYVSNV